MNHKNLWLKCSIVLICNSTREIESNNTRNLLFDKVSSSLSMQSFSSLRQKRKPSDADGDLSPQTKWAACKLTMFFCLNWTVCLGWSLVKCFVTSTLNNSLSLWCSSCTSRENVNSFLITSEPTFFQTSSTTIDVVGYPMGAELLKSAWLKWAHHVSDKWRSWVGGWPYPARVSSSLYDGRINDA